MKMFCTTAMLIVLSVFFSCNNCFADDVIVSGGYTEKNEQVEIVIKTVEIPPNDSFHEKLLWGMPERRNISKPNYIISSIQIFVDKKNILIPASAYCDLANPYEVLFESEKNYFSLVILGGVTSDPYRAELVFEQLPDTNYLRNRIKYRKVYLRTFPDEVWEKTEYSFIVDDER